MKTIIVGAGEVGYHIAERLIREEHDVVIIESDPAIRERVQEELDIMTVEGSGSSPGVLEEAGIREADLLIAVADIDEVNISACILAKEYGVPKRIARVRNPEFSECPFLNHGKKLGIDLLINPNIVVADEIINLIKTPAAAEVAKFAEGKVLMIGLKMTEGAPILNRALKTLKSFQTTTPFLIVAIYRQGKLMIPDGETVVHEGDHLYFISKREFINSILTLLGKKESIVDRIFLIGGGRIGYRVAQILEEEGFHTKLMEQDPHRCEELSKLLKHTLILKGDGTDARALLEEGISEMDAVVAVTDDEATNILAALLAKQNGAKKVIALIKRPHLIPLLPHLGIDAGVSPRITTANVILKYVRKGSVVSIFEIPESDAETMEIAVSQHSKTIGKSIKEIALPPGVIIGAIVHKEEIIIPRGDTILNPDDRVVLFALPAAIPKLEELFT